MLSDANRFAGKSSRATVMRRNKHGRYSSGFLFDEVRDALRANTPSPQQYDLSQPPCRSVAISSSRYIWQCIENTSPCKYHDMMCDVALRINSITINIALSFNRLSVEACQNASCSAEVHTAAGDCCSHILQQLNTSSTQLGRRSSTGCLRERRVRTPCVECIQAAASYGYTVAYTDSISKCPATQTLSACHSQCLPPQHQAASTSFNFDARSAYIKTVDAQLIASSKLLGRSTPGPTTANSGMEICIRYIFQYQIPIQCISTSFY
jgi:hypothetical protein